MQQASARKQMAARNLVLALAAMAGCVVVAIVLGGREHLEPGDTGFRQRTAAIPLGIMSALILGWALLNRHDLFDRDMPRNFDHWVAGILVVYGFLLRVARVWDYGLSPDEGIFVYTSSEPTLLAVWRASVVNVHPPANFFLLHLLEMVSWNVVWLRIGSILGGTAAIGLVYLFMRELRGTAAGLTAAALVAFSPNLIELSRVARNYSPGMAFLLAALWMLARFLKRGQWRDFYLFALFEFLAAWWHYSFIAIFLGANVALLFIGLSRRWTLQQWAIAGLAQVPVGLFYILSFLYHLPRIDAWMIDTVHGYMKDEYTITPRHLIFPMIQVSRYLTGSSLTGKIIFYLALLGGLLLAARRRWLEAALLLAPIPFAYLFAISGKLPLGATRHSAHIYPMIFGLAAVAADELAALRGNTAFPKWAGSTVVLALLLVYMNLSFYSYSEEMVFNINDAAHYRAQSHRIVEAPTRKSDLDKVIRLLKANVGPDDLVLTSYQAFMILRFHLGMTPLSYDPRVPWSFSHENLRFDYSPAASWSFFPRRFKRAVDEASTRLNKRDWKRVWIPHVGWEVWSEKLIDHLEELYPGTQFHTPITDESGGLLFVIDPRTFAAIEDRRGVDEPEE